MSDFDSNSYVNFPTKIVTEYRRNKREQREYGGTCDCIQGHMNARKTDLSKLYKLQAQFYDSMIL